MRIHNFGSPSQTLRNKLTLVVLGRSGSGKGTQADFIVRRLQKEGVRHFETGRFLRELMKKKNLTTEIGRGVMSAGRLFPAWFAAYTWLREIIEKGHADKHLIYDGAPRLRWEAELIDAVMRWHNRPLSICLFIDIGEREATKRLLRRGRRDDDRAAIRNRLKFFIKYVSKSIRYYKEHGRLISINGEQSPENVWREIDSKLKKRLGKRWPSR